MELRRLSVLLAAAALWGCGPGTAAKAVRGDAPTAGGAAGGTCGDEPAPWVIDLPEDRANQLETEIKKGGVVLVKYDCQELKIVRGCDVNGAASYSYSGLTYEAKHKELEDADSAQMALSGGSSFAAKFEADYKSGAMLRIDYASIGRQTTTTEVISRDMLTGSKCGEVTHFVGAMDVGAYSLSSGAAADINAAAEVFGRGASGSSSSKVQNRARGGNPGSCRKASPDDPSPPNDCRSPLWIQLFPIDAASAKSASGPPPRRPPRSYGPFGMSCPSGKVMDSTGSCRSKSSGTAYACSPGNATECAEQCDKGSPQSCARIGYMHEKGEGIPQSDAKAFAAYKKACDSGDLEGCTGLGYMLSKSDKPEDKAQSVGVFRKACEGGSGRACSGLGQQARLRRDWAAASKEFDRGCRLGYTRACYYAGYALIRLDQDEARALALMERACYGGDERGCLAAGSMYSQGSGGKKDSALGSKLTGRGLVALQGECNEKKSESCEVLGDYYNGRYGKTIPQGEKALEYYGKACGAGQEDACWEAGLIYEGGLGGVKKDPAKAKSSFDVACTKGYDDACKKAGKKAPPAPPKPPR